MDGQSTQSVGTKGPRPASEEAAEAWKDVFFKVLRKTGMPSTAYKAAGVTSTTVYRLRNQDVVFRKRWRRALATWKRRAVEEASEAVRSRGVDGWDEPVYQMGRKVGSKRRYSDKAALAWLAAHDRRWQQTRRVEHTGEVHLVPAGAQAKLSDPSVLSLACDLDSRLSAPVGHADPEPIDVQALPAPVGQDPDA